MNGNVPAVAVTTINPPTPPLRALAAGCAERGWPLVVAGDAKSPPGFELEGAEFLGLDAQREISRFARLCPEGTYARKNIAYLRAVSLRPAYLIETDDDNLPLLEFWDRRELLVSGRQVEEAGWVNAYRYFADRFIYPRGFPPELARGSWDRSAPAGRVEGAVCPVQQFLADGDPDVDAIYRMLHDLPFRFEGVEPLVLGAGCWCPFNSQNTVFFPEAFPLLYLPVTCTFRMTDIWRSFVAQRVLWSVGGRAAFLGATVEQIRNPHDLLRDFEQEIPGLLGNKRLVEALDEADLGEGNLADRSRRCYRTLIGAGFISREEEQLLDLWLEDLAAAIREA